MKTHKALEGRKLQIRELLDSTDDVALLDQVYAILNDPDGVWWDEEAEAESIAAADADFAAGRVFTHEQVMENIKRCLKE